MVSIASSLSMFYCAFFYVELAGSVVILDEDEHGKPVWRESLIYRDRSHIPVPSTQDISKENFLTSKYHSQNAKRWKIHRIFFTMPVGSTMPLYYTALKRYKIRKGGKS